MPLFSPATVSYIVPRGFVAILRGFKYGIDPQISGINLADITVSLSVSGIGVQDYTNLMLPQYLPGLIPCYVVADENQIITLRVNFTSNVVQPAGGIFLNAELYGNLLLKTDAPHILEPGNQPVSVKIGS